MTRSNVYKKIIIFSLVSFVYFFIIEKNFLFAESESTWVLAADRFSINKNESEIDSVFSGIQEMIPSRVVENLSSSAYRTISANEELDRTLYKLRNDRISLFLQLSSAVRSRDSIFLNDYSERKLQSLLNEENKKIKAIQQKIDDNLNEQKKAEDRARKKESQQENKNLTEAHKYILLFKGFISSEDYSLSSERVTVYEKNDTNIYNSSETAKSLGYESRAFEKEMVNAKINSLLTGKISILEEYLSVTVELFVYPGAKSAGVVTEVGSLNDVDFICNSLARQISPWISASIPISINLTVQPPEALETLKFSIDDIVYKDLQEEYLIDAGVHSLRFDAEGYKTAITSFAFEGNDKYSIEVELQEEKSGTIFLKMKKPVIGSVYANGTLEDEIDEESRFAKIKINDSIILGQFIGSEEGSGFFYIPERLLNDGEYLAANVKTFDKSEHIDKRRKMMYTSYSVFVVSLLGYIFSKGNMENYYNAYYRDPYDRDIVNTANKWIIANDVFICLTIGSGLWFGYELVRYFIAADSVLPANTTRTNKTKIEIEEKIEDEEKWDSEVN